MQIEFDNYSISPIQEKDAWRLCDFVVSNSERLKTYFPKTVEQNLNPTLAQFFVNKKVKEFMEEKEFLFTIKENTHRTIMGLVYVKELQKVEHQAELAYCIGYQYEGKGIIFQAVKRIIDWGFKDKALQNLQIIVHRGNLGSIKMAEKNGFVWKKTLPKEHLANNGEELDMELYELQNPKTS